MAKFDKSLRAGCLLSIVYILILVVSIFQEKNRSGSMVWMCGVVQLQKGALRLSHLLPCRLVMILTFLENLRCNRFFLCDSADSRYVFCSIFFEMYIRQLLTFSPLFKNQEVLKGFFLLLSQRGDP